jgi:hypothetical protein
MERDKDKSQETIFPRPFAVGRTGGTVYRPDEESDEDSLLQKYLALADQVLNQKKPLN